MNINDFKVGDKVQHISGLCFTVIEIFRERLYYDINEIDEKYKDSWNTKNPYCYYDECVKKKTK